jgi:hypothetical protein
MAAVGELVSGLDAELVRLGYKPSTLKWYRGCWRRLERWFAAQGVQEFSLDVAMTWVDEACGGFFEKEQAGTLKQTDVYLLRVAAMLDDFAVHGSVLRRYSRSLTKLAAGQADVLAAFQKWLRAEGCAVSTIRAYATVAGEFLAFIAGRGGLGGLDGGVIGAFVVTLAGYQAQDGGAQVVRGAVAASVRDRRGADLRGCARDGPGGEVGAAGEGPVGLGPGRCREGVGGDRSRQPVREARLRDRAVDLSARFAGGRRQTSGVC